LSKSRCLIDLTIVGLALSNCTGCIPFWRQMPKLRLQAQIFYEGRPMQQNTVNDCFPARGTDDRAVFD
jgi:hypothetical protein